MHGLIFVTREKYLSERFGSPLLHSYREAIGEEVANAPLASRPYDDATLLQGVAIASQLTHTPVNTLLREYGRYFILNGLTSHLCDYVLSDVRSGRELLLTMRDVHARLRRSNEGLTPPLFNYETPSQPNIVVLIYDSPRQVCPLLWGAIEGAAARYGERVAINEQSCMKRGASFCRFEATFTEGARVLWEKTPEQQARQAAQKQLAQLVWNALPPQGRSEGMTLSDMQHILPRRGHVSRHDLRPAVLLEALQHLQFAGLVCSTANNPLDELTSRRYWRVQTYWDANYAR